MFLVKELLMNNEAERAFITIKTFLKSEKQLKNVI